MRLVILGAGGHGKVVMEAAVRAGMTPLAFLDDARAGTTLMGLPVLAERAASLDGLRARGGIVALGQNALRLRLGEKVRQMELELVSVISPDAVISPSCTIGPGSLVMPRAVINAMARLGEAVIVNTGAIVEHDCEIGDGVHMAPGTVACGGVAIGARTMIGAGTTIIPGCRIGADATIGAGATVVRDIAAEVCATGIPARPRKAGH